MPAVELHVAALGSRDGMTVEQFEPGVHDVPDALAACWRELGIGGEPVEPPADEPAVEPEPEIEPEIEHEPKRQTRPGPRSKK